MNKYDATRCNAYFLTQVHHPINKIGSSTIAKDLRQETGLWSGGYQ